MGSVHHLDVIYSTYALKQNNKNLTFKSTTKNLFMKLRFQRTVLKHFLPHFKNLLSGFTLIALILCAVIKAELISILSQIKKSKQSIHQLPNNIIPDKAFKYKCILNSKKQDKYRASVLHITRSKRWLLERTNTFSKRNSPYQWISIIISHRADYS